MTGPEATATETQVEPLVESLKRLARGEATDLAGLLHDVESQFLVDGTLVTAHCHCLKLDANGRPRLDDMVKVIEEHVLDYAIPRGEIRNAFDAFARTRSSQKLVRLRNEARSLFTDLEKSGEGGELLLFVLAEKLLQLPQLICKMSFKTNSRMHVHGADGLHVGVDPSKGNLLLYWGESKIYGNVTDAVRECLASLRPMLSDHAASQRDLQLLQRHADLDSPELEAALKKFLDPDAPEFNSLEFRGLCLVGFDCDSYPTGPSTNDITSVAKVIAQTLPGWRNHLQKRIGEEKLTAFAMHFLFLPFPSADGFRQLLREKLGVATTPTAVSSTPPNVAVTATAPAAPAAAPATPTSAASKNVLAEPKATESKGAQNGSA